VGNSKITCWVCTSNNEVDEHHVIPQSAGGTKGPTKPLCVACHDGIHKVATSKILTDANLLNIMPYLTEDGIAKCKKLIRAILLAHKLVRHDPNKKMMLQMTLNGEQKRKLLSIKKRYGLSSIAKTVIFCLENTE